MKIYLFRYAVVSILLVASCSIATENSEDHMLSMIRQQWVRMQAEFKVLRLLDAGKGRTALHCFQTVQITNSIGDQTIIEGFTNGETNNVRIMLNEEINRWIIQEAGHSQRPALTVLLDNPERLQFLKELADYRAAHTNQLSGASDKFVADILKKAKERRPLDEINKK